MNQMFSAAFPDLQVAVHDIIAEHDKVVVRATFSGTHKGEFMGIAPTDQEITVKSIGIARLSKGKIVQRWE